METSLTAQTSIDYAAGAAVISRPSSVFDTVAELTIYRDRWVQRCRHYQTLRAYYKGTVYNDEQLRRALKLYSGIRQIFGPLRRAVNVDVAKVPGGWTIDQGNPEEDRPAVPAPVAAAVKQIRAWSDYRASYSRAVKHGAVAGEFGLLVVDDQIARTIQIIPLRPDEVVTGTMSDGLPFGLVIKCGLVDRDGQYEYAQLITPNTITTFRNGVQHDFGGGAKRPNVQGFVPLLLSPYLAGEDGIGENAFAGTQELLDRVNDAASQALDVIQRNAEPLTVFAGVEEVVFDPENNAVKLTDPQAKVYTVAPNLVIDQALSLIEKVLNEFKNLLPQLILDVLTSRNDLAYDTVITLCMELIDHVTDVRTQVDTAIETAERWALQIGMQMGVFSGIDPTTHRLDPERPVIQPGPTTRLALEGQRKALTAPQQAAGQPKAAPASSEKEPSE
jgi:hypothetical protein